LSGVSAIVAPIFLVLLSSTSFIAARAVASNADPMLFLFARFLIVFAAFALLACKVKWPKGLQLIGHLLTGMIINGIYLVASWWAVANGLAAGIMTLLGALQPILATLAMAMILRTPIGSRICFGLGAGLFGVALVLSPRLEEVHVTGLPTLPVVIGLISVVALTFGTILQKSSIAVADLRATGALQHLGAAIVAGAALLWTGTYRWGGTPLLWVALAWSVGGLSLIGTSLFVWMVRCGEVTRVTTLMLLVPPATALQAWILFGEELTSIQLAGFVIALTGVLIVQSAHIVWPLGRRCRSDANILEGSNCLDSGRRDRFR
jgi:drug/metabolite transporter (DMT)-like permease